MILSVILLFNLGNYINQKHIVSNITNVVVGYKVICNSGKNLYQCRSAIARETNLPVKQLDVITLYKWIKLFCLRWGECTVFFPDRVL